MDTAAFFDAAVSGFEHRIAAVRDGQWHAPTPCTDWDVRGLVQHVVNECRWIQPLIDGQTIAQVGDRLDGDLLGADPKAAWHEASSEALAAIARPDALSRTVHLSFGDRSGDEYISQVACDIAIHTWDLARGTGGDDRLDPAVAQASLEEIEGWGSTLEEWRAAGAFGPATDIPPSADAQTRLLALVGRRAQS